MRQISLTITVDERNGLQNTLPSDLKANYGMLTGELTRHTVPQLTDKQSKQLLNKPLVTLDLSKVSKVDTAGLAWLLLQIELAQAKPCQLVFAHLPSELIKLAELSAVDDFLIRQPTS